MVMSEDRTLVCKDCGVEFEFTAGEQDFYAEKGFQNEPTRCGDCRAANKVRRSSNRETFEAICSECGKAAHLTFVPKNDRPVYCSDCFAARRASG